MSAAFPFRRLCRTPGTRGLSTRTLQHRLPAAYYRGGTSRAIMFRRDHLPRNEAEWPAIFLGSIGSPDPYGRQLDGMGGGISSLSKVCIVGPSSQPGADVDYTFVSLGIRNTDVDYSSNCGNMSAAVGPFAVDSGLVTSPIPTDSSGNATVRIFNVNTQKMIHSTFPVIEGEAVASGDLVIDGVSGSAASVRLDFIDPAGTRTGKLLPTGNARDTIEGVPATLIDAGNPCCFVQAADLRVRGTLTPAQIEEDSQLLSRLDAIRREAGVRMGLAATRDEVPGSVPKIAMVAAPVVSEESPLRGPAVTVRALSVGQPHKAIPVTVALALAAAARLPGTTVVDCVRGYRGSAWPSDDASSDADGDGFDVLHASGSLKVSATYDGPGKLAKATVFRTARRLMDGTVYWK